MAASPLVIAVVDDDPDIRRLLSAIAASCGDVVVEAGTFERGQIVLREYPWDIAIIDRQLPGGDGLDLCRDIAEAVRESDTHRHIIFLSASDASDEKLRGFDAGADDYLAKPADPTELRARLRAIRRAVLAQKALLARLAAVEQLSVIDGLTQVFNHRFFTAELRRLFDIATRHGRPLSLAMIDLDLFKRVNDTHGHRAGDLVLTEVSTAIVQSVRSSDVVARYGGEEFVVLLPETPLVEAAAVAERIRAAVEALELDVAGTRLRITISSGIAAVPAPDILSPVRLVEAADRALYEAKADGRNRVRIHSTAAAGGPVALTRINGS
jgi:diguanylate cyclase (GGDEF)-like protein